MNYKLKDLQDRVNKLIEQQGEDAECAAWIYTKHDCHLKDEDGEFDYNNNVEELTSIVLLMILIGVNLIRLQLKNV